MTLPDHMTLLALRLIIAESRTQEGLSNYYRGVLHDLTKAAPGWSGRLIVAARAELKGASALFDLLREELDAVKVQRHAITVRRKVLQVGTCLVDAREGDDVTKLIDYEECTWGEPVIPDHGKSAEKVVEVVAIKFAEKGGE